MARATLPTLTYLYDGYKPIQGLDEAEIRMRRAHKYRNALVRNELRRRRAVNAILRELNPELVVLDAEIEKLNESIKENEDAIDDASVDARRKVRPTHLVKKVKEDKAERKLLREKVKALKNKLFSASRFSGISAAISKWSEGNASAPGWLSGDRRRTPEELLTLIERWSTHRVRGDDKVFESCLKWKKGADTFPTPGSADHTAALEWQRRSIPLKIKYDARDKKLQKASGLHWGTYNHVDQSMSNRKKGTPPVFKKWRGDGHLAVQRQPKGGRGEGADRVTGEHLMVREAMAGTDSWIRIEPLSTDAGLSKARLKETKVWLRIDSVGRAPLWVVIPIRMHRPIPDDAHIMQAHLIRKRIATRDHWQVTFILARPSGWKKPDCASSGHVALDVGWRIRPEREVRKARMRAFGKAVFAFRQWQTRNRSVIPTWLAEANPESPQQLSDVVYHWIRNRFEHDRLIFGEFERWRKWDIQLSWPGPALRCAYYMGSDGEEGEILLPPRWLQHYKHLRDLQSLRDKKWNAIIKVLHNWLKVVDSVPDWVTERLRGVSLWKKKPRLLGVFEYWRRNRFSGDEEVFAQLAHWREREVHLWNWEANRRKRLQASRKCIFRNAIAAFRRRYETGRIEELDLRDFQILPEPEDPPPNEYIKRYNRAACLSSLIETIEWSMAKTIKVKAKYTTMRCARCGHIEDFAREKLEKICPKCEHKEDQDRGAAINIGARALQS